MERKEQQVFIDALKRGPHLVSASMKQVTPSYMFSTWELMDSTLYLAL